jgi:nucleoside-diphosphate-sugar epimerase
MGHVGLGRRQPRDRRALGWKPRYDFERGFKQMVAWMRADPDRADRYRSARSA